jgi:hypothetical protein
VVSVSVRMDSMGTAWRTGVNRPAPAQHALGGRIGRAQRGVRLQRLQALEQPVVLGVRQFGRIQHVVLVGVMVQRGRSCAARRPPRAAPAFHSSAWQGPVELS